MTPTGSTPVGVFAFREDVVAEQDRKSVKRTTRTADEGAAVQRSGVTEKGEKLKKTINDVLDEIDNVLEENAEEFVKSYVQRGGE